MEIKAYYKKENDITQVAIFKDGKFSQNYFIKDDSIVNDLIVGKVIRIDKQIGIFVDIGRSKNAILKYNNKLKIGDYVLVKVTRNEVDDKGAIVSEDVSITGSYCIVSKNEEIKFSSKLTEEDKIRLFKIKPRENTGIIFRTNSKFATIAEIENEIDTLNSKLNAIINEARNTQKIKTLYKQTIIEFIKTLVTIDSEIINSFDPIKKEIESINNKEVFVDGIRLVIEKTEAMTTIDVNKHKYVSKYYDIDDVNLDINKKALIEIMNQIKLRNIGGLIAIDLINLIKKESIENLISFLIDLIQNDDIKMEFEFYPKSNVIILIRKKFF